MSLFNILVIAIALSMDTFSLSLSLSLLVNNTKILYIYLVSVTIFHFIYPLLGNKLGVYIINYMGISSNKILGIIFFILFIKLLIDLIISKDKDININPINIIILAILVSIDSFITGIGLINIKLIYLFIISSVAFIFTFIGLKIGIYARKETGKIANIFGLILLLLLSLFHLCK